MHSRDRLKSDRTRLLALPVLFCLGACSVGPDYVAPAQDLPARWNGGASAARPAAPSEWWRQFKDPVLNGLVTEAIAGNLDVAQAKARIREARASRIQAVAPLFPQVNGSASATRSRYATSSDSGGGNGMSNSFRAGFDTSWELDIFGGRDRAVEAATYGVDAADDDLDGVLLTLIGDVASAVIEARGYQARLALARRTVETQRVTEALTRVRFQAGDVSAVDTARAVAQVASTEAQIPALETALAQTLHRIAVLVGRPPSAMGSRLTGAGKVPSTPAPPQAGVPADVLRNRPDVRRAERSLAQATARIGQAEAVRYPSVSLTGNISTSALKLGDLAKNSAIGWSIGPSLSVPIFNGGELAAAVDVARARRDQSDAALRLAVLSALQDVEDALVGLRQERLRLASLSTAAAASGQAAQLSQALYQSGGASFLDVLDAQRSQYGSEDSRIQSQIALATRFIALNKALGGGWLRPVEVSRPRVEDPPQGPRLRALSLEAPSP